METIEELKAQIAVLQEAAKHVGIHHRDDMATQKARSARVVANAVLELQDSLVAMSRGPDKMPTVMYLIESAIHRLTNHNKEENAA